MADPIAVVADPGVNPYLALVIQHGATWLMDVLGIVLLPVIHKFLGLFEQHTNIKVSQDTEAKIDQLVSEALTHAEEWALGKVKSNIPKPSGAEKMDAALAFAESEAKRLGVDVQSKEWLKKKIEAQLGGTRG